MDKQFVPRVEIRADRNADYHRQTVIVTAVAACMAIAAVAVFCGAIIQARRLLHCGGVVEFCPVCEYCGQLMTGGEHRCSGGK